MASKILITGVNDLQSQFPEIAKEWHPTLNGDLKPTQVTKSSGKKVWWQCSKHTDHEWETTIFTKTSGSSCPICVGQKVLEGFNDLNTTDPEIAKEWHPTRNGDLKPTEISRGTGKKVWWQCSKYPDHEWDAKIANRTINGRGCPICVGRKVLKGFNDLKTTDPELATEWHPTRNEDLKPTDFTRGSGKKVWWQCIKYPDHEWDAVISSRSLTGRGCPFCSSNKVLEGFNDLNTTEPELAKEWHPTRNGDLKATQVSRSSDKKVWWQCSNYPDHEWVAVIGSRTTGIGCSICDGKTVLEGFNDLKSQFPELVKEWHPTKNGNLKPTDFTKSSGKKVWWQCSKYPDHEWDSVIASRSQGCSCPICEDQRVLEGFNDLKTTDPELAKEWHPTRNGDLKSTDVVKGSGKKVWWQCSKYPDHEWEATIASRTRGSRCSICIGQKVLVGFNDLNTTDPEIAKEWHPTRNGNLKPADFTRGSSAKKVWWQCSKDPDHEWCSKVASRSINGCPICAEYGFNPEKDAWFYLMQRPAEQQFGITNDFQTRMQAHERNGWSLIDHTSVPSSGQKVFDIEKLFKRWLKKEIGLLEGTTENWSTTKMEVQSLAELKARSGIETDLF